MLNSPSIIPFQEIEEVGVAIKSSEDGQNHIGILYLDENDTVQMLHFANQNHLINEVPKPYYFWLNLGDSFQSRDKSLIRAFLLDILSNIYNQLPQVSFNYGFEDIAPVFDGDGSILPERKDASFTCASFVLSLFESLGYSLIKYDEWPLDDEKNKQWQQSILDLLLHNFCITPDQYQAQQQKIGARRFLPEEVAAATQLSRPASYEDVSPVAKIIAAEIKI